MGEIKRRITALFRFGIQTVDKQRLMMLGVFNPHNKSFALFCLEGKKLECAERLRFFYL